MIPRYCVILIKLDRDKRRLAYLDINCMTPTPSGPTKMISAVLSGHEKLVDQSRTPGTPDFFRLAKLLPEASAATGTLFPDTPPTVNKIVALSAVMIAMQGEFDPEHIGGTTRIGVLVQGKLPAVHQALNLSLGY
jgi:hypothetical protein